MPRYGNQAPANKVGTSFNGSARWDDDCKEDRIWRIANSALKPTQYAFFATGTFPTIEQEYSGDEADSSLTLSSELAASSMRSSKCNPCWLQLLKLTWALLSGAAVVIYVGYIVFKSIKPMADNLTLQTNAVAGSGVVAVAGIIRLGSSVAAMMINAVASMVTANDRTRAMNKWAELQTVKLGTLFPTSNREAFLKAEKKILGALILASFGLFGIQLASLQLRSGKLYGDKALILLAQHFVYFKAISLPETAAICWYLGMTATLKDINERLASRRIGVKCIVHTHGGIMQVQEALASLKAAVAQFSGTFACVIVVPILWTILGINVMIFLLVSGAAADDYMTEAMTVTWLVVSFVFLCEVGERFEEELGFLVSSLDDKKAFFDVAGFGTMNRKAILSATGTILTYTIVFMQFRST